MTNPKPFAKRTQAQLTTHIRSMAANSINLFFTGHIKQRMRQRKITNACVLSVLRGGKVIRVPDLNTMKGTVECRMEHYCTGHNIGIVVALSDTDPTLILVTALII